MLLTLHLAEFHTWNKVNITDGKEKSAPNGYFSIQSSQTPYISAAFGVIFADEKGLSQHSDKLHSARAGTLDYWNILKQLQSDLKVFYSQI